MLKFDLFSIFKGTNDMITQETYIIVLEKKIGQYPVMTLHMHWGKSILLITRDGADEDSGLCVTFTVAFTGDMQFTVLLCNLRRVHIG